MPPSGTFAVAVHHFESPTAHACAYEAGPANANNALVFIGGLGDGPHTVPYPRAIAKRLETEPQLNYSVFEFRLRSSFAGFGFTSLDDDVADISALVTYLRSIGREHVVLLGHSTGSQDCMHYANSGGPAPVEGYILQAPVCDRGALSIEMGGEFLDKSLAVAKNLITSDEGDKGEERISPNWLPSSFRTTPISARRWYSLGATDGEDNYFDPDRPDDVVAPFWHRVDKPILILHSGKDEYIPPHVNKEALIQRWKSLCRPGIASELSGLIPGANHRVEEKEAEEWLVNTVVKFLQSIN